MLLTQRCFLTAVRNSRVKLQLNAAVIRCCSTVQGEVRVRFAPSPTGKVLTKIRSVKCPLRVSIARNCGLCLYLCLPLPQLYQRSTNQTHLSSLINDDTSLIENMGLGASLICVENCDPVKVVFQARLCTFNTALLINLTGSRPYFKDSALSKVCLLICFSLCHVCPCLLQFVFYSAQQLSG